MPATRSARVASRFFPTGQSLTPEAGHLAEPFVIEKAPGAEVLSGAVNGERALVVRATRAAGDSRYARIMAVMRETETRRPRLRRLGDRLGAFYTPVALAIAGGAWAVSGDPVRFLSVLVVATPCPLLIAIPVAIVGAISLAARRGIIVRDPAIMERVGKCRTILFDKTGTLTAGMPSLVGETLAPGVESARLLARVAGLERYSKHPLGGAILEAARAASVPAAEIEEIGERPGEGLRGRVDGHEVTVTGRSALARLDPAAAAALPAMESGLECVILVDGRFAGLYRFRDAARADGRPFVEHLARKHGFTRVLLVSGDREPEVARLAHEVGISEVHAAMTPEAKVAIVTAETRRARTIYVGDGINDAPALAAATVGLAFGPRCDVVGDAAGAVILEASLRRVDEFLHVSRRMRRVALQSAVGGMALSMLGMALASAGLLTPIVGAVGQEVIDLLAVLNALRAAAAP